MYAGKLPLSRAQTTVIRVIKAIEINQNITVAVTMCVSEQTPPTNSEWESAKYRTVRRASANGIGAAASGFHTCQTLLNGLRVTSLMDQTTTTRSLGLYHRNDGPWVFTIEMIINDYAHSSHACTRPWI